MALENLPPGKRVDAGGFRLHVMSAGTGGPPLVLIGALQGSAAEWSWVQRELARTLEVLALDLPGHGFSEVSPHPRHPQQIISEIQAALRQLGLLPPYVLVGQSLGALHARLYAQTFPDEVMALVLIDPAHPQMFRRLPPVMRSLERMSRLMLMLNTLASSIGLGAWVAARAPRELDLLPPEAAASIHAMLKRGSFWRTVMAENRESRRYMAEPGLLRQEPIPLPLLVISAGASFQPDGMSQTSEAQGLPIVEINQAWRGLHQEIAAMSERSEHVVIEGATHLNILADPAYARQVAEAIREMIEALL